MTRSIPQVLKRPVKITKHISDFLAPRQDASCPANTEYAQLQWTDRFSMLVVMIRLPAVLLWKALTTSYASHNRDRSLRRILGDAALRHCLAHLSAAQLQSLTGTTVGTYMNWSKQFKLPTAIDELEEDAKLLWIGPKQLERVILFVHGGAFMLPLPDVSLSFWKYVQAELEKRQIHVGVAVLNYSLTPPATFPTPLKQTYLAVEFLLAAGVQPHNLQIVGNSAGGNLIIQLISQILHPCAAVQEIRLPAPLRGVCLISPWVALTPDSRSSVENAGKDYLSVKPFSEHIRPQFAEVDPAFAEASKAPEGWFNGAERVFERMLITAGSAECLRDDIVEVGNGLKASHSIVELVFQKGGIHVDMYLDFFVKEKKLGSLTPLIVEWFAAGFA
ncbi:Alpha/Beta hydrolase protein [Mycena galericulata]|nr:Alpha/Beta hydrolase protein [Mycena galericulata]